MGYTRIDNSKKCKGIFRQYLAASAALISMLIDGTFTGWATPCLPLLLSPESPIPMSSEEISWMMAFLFVGQIVSPVPSAFLMDRIGRKTTMICMTFFPIYGWLILAFATNALMLMLAMFLAGFWIGSAYTVAPMYLGEIAEPSVRGRIVTLLSVITRVGILIEIVLGIFLPFYILPIVSLSVPILFLLIFPWVPESPYFYLLRKDRNSASKSLRWLRGDLTEDEVNEELDELEESVNRQLKDSHGIIDLVRSQGSLKALITVQILSVLQRLSGMGPIMGYISTTLPITSISSPVCVLIIDSVRLLSGIVSSVLVDYVGRRILLISTAFFCGLMMYSAGTWYFLNTMTAYDVTWLSIAPFICFIVHGLSFSLGLGPVCSSIRSEYFPMNTKATSSAITSTVLAFASFIINKSYLFTSKTVGMYVNYWVYGTSCFTIAVFSWFVLIETKGKSLQQIQDELNCNQPPMKQQPPIYSITEDNYNTVNNNRA